MLDPYSLGGWGWSTGTGRRGRTMSFTKSEKYTDYRDVIFYRRAWIWILSILLFLPFTVLIGLTGDVYTGNDKDGKVKLFPKTYRIIISLCFLFLILLRIFGPILIQPER